MKKRLRLGMILLGAAAFGLTAANANCGSGREAPKEMKCQAGKCGSGMIKPKELNSQAGNTETADDKNVTKKAPTKGKCGG